MKYFVTWETTPKELNQLAKKLGTETPIISLEIEDNVELIIKLKPTNIMTSTTADNYWVSEYIEL